MCISTHHGSASSPVEFETKRAAVGRRRRIPRGASELHSTTQQQQFIINHQRLLLHTIIAALTVGNHGDKYRYAVTDHLCLGRSHLPLLPLQPDHGLHVLLQLSDQVSELQDDIWARDAEGEQVTFLSLNQLSLAGSLNYKPPPPLSPPPVDTWRQDSSLHAVLGRLHHLLQGPPLRLPDQRHRAARAAGSGRPADAVNVVLRGGRHGEVYHLGGGGASILLCYRAEP